ncbi:iron ABC transporter permease [Paenibacillus sp. PDC88]|uniref:ABC transporter permease n=1 Tax=Paenibacillus sp. PDC88 TaxID=1884375 RepID=UPI000898200C|nr:iron ABC transporter permease [Paenibacillus sp. PDC88]SDW91755.1 iron(III) transport system permease protein [Paenibacillus sp. PDC88]
MLDRNTAMAEQKRNERAARSSLFSSPSVYKKTGTAIGILLTLFFFILPIIQLLLLSFRGEEGFTLGIYSELFRQDRFWNTLKSTFVIVLGSTVLSLVMGLCAAWFMAYTDIKHKRLLHLLILLSFVLPSYVLTLSWSSFMGSQGLMASFLQLFNPDAKPWSMYSTGGIIFVMGIHHFPLVYMFTTGVLKKIPRDLEWAAKAGGAGRVKTFVKITLPLALPGITAGGLLVFLASLDNFGIPAFLGSPVNISVLSTLIYEEIIGFGPSAFARGASLSVILGLVAIAGTWLQWLSVRKSKTSDTIMMDEEPRYFLGKHRAWISSLIWIGLIGITIVPLFSMVSLSLRSSYGGGFSLQGLTLDNYKYILFENSKIWQAITNSLMLSLFTLLACLIIGTLFAYVRVRKPSRLNKAAELAISIPYTLPGIVFALSMILVWMEPIPGWNPGIYGTVTILFIAYICRFLILQIRAGVTAFMQIDASMEEAARVSGAGMFTKWRTILLPLLLPGLLSGALLVFLTALTELTVSALLYSSGSQTIGVTIFSFEQAGDTLYSTALSSLIVFLIIIGAGLLQLIQYLSRRKGVRL